MPTKLHLLIVEFDYHAEVLSALIPMLQERFRIIVFTTEKIAKKLHLDDQGAVRVELKGSRESVAAFFRRSAHIWQEVDVVYFNTLEKHFRFFAAWDPGVPVIMRIHNVNATLRPWQSIDFKHLSLLKVIWYLIYKAPAWYFKSRMLHRAESLMLPSDGIRELAMGRGWLAERSNIAPFCLPFASPQPLFSPLSSAATTRLAVTGTVDPERKNYDELYRALKIAKISMRGDIELHFLGPPKGKPGLHVIKQFETLNDERFCFRYSLHYVPQVEVEQVMRSVDFIVAPLVARTRFKIHQEFYGKTKVSGVEVDILRFGMPALLPQSYSLAKAIAAGCGFYAGEEDLAELLVRWVNNKEFNAKKEALSTLDSSTTITMRFEQFCQKLINDQVRAKVR